MATRTTDVPPQSATARYQRIWRTVADIPRGRVATYGQVAELAGLPRRARLVGRALREAPEALDLPWHRVLRAGGVIAFPVHSEPYRQQRARLEHEGVAVIGGRVDLACHGWRPSLDELLWKPRD